MSTNKPSIGSVVLKILYDKGTHKLKLFFIKPITYKALKALGRLLQHSPIHSSISYFVWTEYSRHQWLRTQISRLGAKNATWYRHGNLQIFNALILIQVVHADGYACWICMTQFFAFVEFSLKNKNIEFPSKMIYSCGILLNVCIAGQHPKGYLFFVSVFCFKVSVSLMMIGRKFSKWK